jgi:hypothetical protein
MAAVTENRNFFSCPLLLYYKLINVLSNSIPNKEIKMPVTLKIKFKAPSKEILEAPGSL